MKRNFFILLAGGVLFTLSSCGNSSSPSSPLQTPTSPSNKKKLSISAPKNALAVGETVTLSAQDGDGNVVAVLWRTSDASIASVQSSKLIAYAPGEVTVTAALAEDLSVKASYAIHVLGSSPKPSKVGTRSIEITGPLASTSFYQGDFFDLSSLEVTLTERDLEGNAVSTHKVSDFTSNPKSGSLLSTPGDFTAVISYLGAESVAFPYSVSPAPLDETLTEVIQALSSSDHFVVKTEGSVSLASGTTRWDVTHTYGKNAYYRKEENRELGYAYQIAVGTHLRGVFGYAINPSTKEVVPGGYVAHDNWSSFAAVPKFDMFDPDLAPKRTNSKKEFLYEDGDLNAALVNYAGLSGTEAYVGSVRASVLSPTSFQVNLQYLSSIGSIRFTVSEIGNQSLLPEIAKYLSDGKGGAEVDPEVVKIRDALKSDTYAIDLGTHQPGLGLQIPIGKIYHTPNYRFTDYTQEYLDFYNQAEKGPSDPDLTDNGVILLDGVVRSATSIQTAGKDSLTVGDPVEGISPPLAQSLDYYSSIRGLEDSYLDTFLPVKEDSSTVYLSLDSTVAEDFARLAGTYSDTEVYVPVGLSMGDVVKDADGNVSGLSLTYRFRYNGNTVGLEASLEQVGTASLPLLEEELSKGQTPAQKGALA